MNDPTSYRFPWQIGKRSEVQTQGNLLAELGDSGADSTVNSRPEPPSAEATERNDGCSSSDENVLIELSPNLTSSPNDDLEELERSVIDMEKVSQRK